MKSSNFSSNNRENSLTGLFLEIGGDARLEEILSKFYLKMSKDIMLGFFFSGKDLSHIVKQQKAFLLRAMGQKKTYSGKSPKAAHREIPPILEGHFDRRLILLSETLEEAGLTQKYIKIWIDFEEQFRKAIVEKEAPLSQRRHK